MKYIIVFVTSFAILFSIEVDYSTASGKKKIERVKNYSSRPWYSFGGPLTEKKLDGIFSKYEKKKTAGTAANRIFFQKGSERYEFADIDGDKKYESERYYGNSLLLHEADIEPETGIYVKFVSFNKEGEIQFVKLDKDKNGYFDEVHYYSKNRIQKIFKDDNGDTLFEKLTFFQSDGSVFSVESSKKRKDRSGVPVFLGVYKEGKELKDLSEKISSQTSSFSTEQMAEIKSCLQKNFKNSQIYMRSEISYCISQAENRRVEVLLADVIEVNDRYLVLLRGVGVSPEALLLSQTFSYPDLTSLQAELGQDIVQVVRPAASADTADISE